MNEEIKKLIPELGDNSCKIYPVSGYGDPDLIRYLMENEKPNGIMHFTDPRFWIWLYQMEHEIRQTIPIMFYTIWDDLPYPKYNENYYESCDSIAGISKQTVNIVRNVRTRNPLKSTMLKYIPHGIDRDVFYPIEENSDEHKKKMEYRKKVLGSKDIKFAVFYNNRNIRRKKPGDVILSFKTFADTLSDEEKKQCALLMHTAPVDNNGTDLIAVKNAMAPDCNIFFSNQRLDPVHMNYLYNIVDVTVNIASNEGFGLSCAESIMAGTVVINNITGGLQDQVGFVDENGEYLDVNKHYCTEWGSNHDGKYKKCGSYWSDPLQLRIFLMTGANLKMLRKPINIGMVYQRKNERSVEKKDGSGYIVTMLG
jgi:glycosyltransferase involved in cell wall biosynthesis